MASSDSECDNGRGGPRPGNRSPLTALSIALAALKPTRGENRRSYGDLRLPFVSLPQNRRGQEPHQRSPLANVKNGASTMNNNGSSSGSTKQTPLMESSITESGQHIAITDPPLASPETMDDVLLNLSTHTDMPESDQAILAAAGQFQPYVSNGANGAPMVDLALRTSPLYKPFPINEGANTNGNFMTKPTTNAFAPPPLIPGYIREMQPIHSAASTTPTTTTATATVVNAPGRSQSMKVFSETEYENAESDMPFSETDSQLLSCSPETRMLHSTRLLVPGVNLALDSPVGSPYAVTSPPGAIAVMNPMAFRDDTVLLHQRFGTKFMNGAASINASLADFSRYASLEYLALDAGHEADIDSLSSRCSSRVQFDDYKLQLKQQRPFFQPSAITAFSQYKSPLTNQRRGPQTNSASGPVANGRSTKGYDSEYDNYRPGMRSDEEFFRPEAISDLEDLDYFGPDGAAAGLRQLTEDIQKSFGDFKLTSFSDVESDTFVD